MEFLPIDFLDLVESGEAQVVLPTTDTGYKSYGSGRLLLPAATNYCTNPASVGTKWGTDQGADLVFTRESAADVPLPPGFTSCTKAVHASGSYPGSALVAPFSVAANEVYTISVYINCAENSGDSFNIGLDTLNNGVVVREPAANFGVTATGQGFIRFVRSVTIAASGENQLGVRCWVNAAPNTGAWYLTGMLLEKSSVATPYFDGSYSDCSWTGAANASTSTRPVSALEYSGYVTLSSAGVTAAGTHVAYFRNSGGTYYGPGVVAPTAKSVGWQTNAALLWSDPVTLFRTCDIGDLVLPLIGDSLGYRKVA